MENNEHVASRVREYLQDNPELWKSLDLGIVNLSALSRLILKDLELESFDAVMGALKRIPVSGISMNTYRNILKKSKIESRTDISVLILKPTTENLKLLIELTKNLTENYSDYRIIQATQGYGIVVGDELLEKISRFIPKTEIISKSTGLGEIIIVSSNSILSIKGYVSYASGLLSNRGINILQIVSFFTDITFILQPRDLLSALDIFLSVKRGK
ncbi:MAG: ACT domain-containing protein [Candidatus Thermoplasmatota archaeon]|jgi:hypothetical protein|nr:ACT domain-containing protein [Candidatus Thermoplasmatota archaeon]MCL5955001.1 ACT domain-containing protein [Candidatus Thermoplasmatota archaeon]